MKTFDVASLVRKNIVQMVSYSSARDEYSLAEEGITFLDANENPFENGMNRYPDPHQKLLKEEIAARRNISSEELILGNGSDEILDLLLRAFCQPGQDNIVTLPPTYGMYGVLSGIHDVEVRQVALGRDFQPRVDEILLAMDQRTKLIFICSPNNPTGNTISESAIETLLSSFSGLVVIDEAYIDFSAKESWISRLNEFPNLVVLQTLSKAYGLAGIRLGIGVASTAVITILKKIKLPYNVNVLTQQTALNRLIQTQELQKEMEEIMAQRDLMESEFAALDFVRHVYKSDANFLLIRVDNADKRYRQLLEKGIVVRNRSKEYLCDNTLRITIGTSEENQKLLAAMKEITKESTRI